VQQFKDGSTRSSSVFMEAVVNRALGAALCWGALSTAALVAGCVAVPDGESTGASSPDIITASQAGGAPLTLSLPGIPTAPGLAALQAAASQTASAFVASRPAILQVSPRDAFVQGRVESFDGIAYVPYERTYAGLPVVGGDFVTVIDRAGQVAYHSVALQRPLDLASITPKLSQAAAATIATQRLRSVTGVEGTELVVYALDASPRLAWQSTVNGTVDVDALTGAVLREQEHVMYGTGTAAWNGPNPVALNTTQSGTTFSMTDPSIRNLSCQDSATNVTFSGADDLWGNGNATSRETGCVDALFGAQIEARMLTQWLGRNAMDGAGGAWPIRVGLAQANAFYDGTQVQVGHNGASQWIGALDIIGHEMGHGIDDHTPGGISGNGTQEFVADTFGAATEWFASEPSPFDVPDFTVGEQVNLMGNGPIRNMAVPRELGAPNCFSSLTPTTEVHDAAGPGNHWFYLVAEGSNPTNGQPTSPTCNGSTVVGLGVQTAIRIMYNAMLQKTTGSSYLTYRTWTLQAARNLFPGSCTQFNTVKAAWDAVNVPAQAGDPTCVTAPATLRASQNPVVVPVGSTTSTFTLTWNAPGFSTVDLYGRQNLQSPGQTLFLGSGPTSGSAPEPMSVGEVATLWLYAHGDTTTPLATLQITGIQGATMTASQNPVIVPAGQTTTTFTLSWNAPGHSQVDLWGRQNLESPGQTLFLGTGASSGTALEPMSVGEVATLWLYAHGDTTTPLAVLHLTGQH